MTGPYDAQRLVDAGFEPAEAEARAELVARAVAAFTTTTGLAPRWAWFVPGRIEVFGKHTDYAGGRSLVAAVPRGFAVVCRPRPDQGVRVIDGRWNDVVTVDLGAPARAIKGWGNYASVVAHRLAMNFPGARLGADIAITSDLPRAAGLSSSSALVVGLALALARAGTLTARPEWASAIGSTFDLAGYLGAVENGLAFDALSSADGVGTHGGSEDHTAILASAPGRVRAFSYIPVRHAGEAPMPAAWQFVVMTSGVHADKAGRVKGRYNRASLSTRALAELWTLGGGATGPLGAVLDGPEAEARLAAAIGAPGHNGFSREELQARLAHFVGENRRVDQALHAFREASAERLGALAAASQADAGALLGNQVEETDALTSAALGAGAFAASSFGAGFGGSVWALIDHADAARYAGEWEARYRTSCPGANPVEWFATRPGPAALEVALNES